MFGCGPHIFVVCAWLLVKQLFFYNGGIIILVPDKAPDSIASVIKIEVEGHVANVNQAEKNKMKTGALDWEIENDEIQIAIIFSVIEIYECLGN